MHPGLQSQPTEQHPKEVSVLHSSQAPFRNNYLRSESWMKSINNCCVSGLYKTSLSWLKGYRHQILKPLTSFFSTRIKKFHQRWCKKGRFGGGGVMQLVLHWWRIRSVAEIPTLCLSGQQQKHSNPQISNKHLSRGLGCVFPFFHLIAFSRPPPMVIIHCSLSLLWLIRAISGSPGIRVGKGSGVFSVINTVSVLLRIKRRRKSSRWCLPKLLIPQPGA